MKKTVLAVLLVIMIVTPCFAQEIEPQGLFTLNDTVWVSSCERDEEKCIPYGYISFSKNSIFYESIKSSQSFVMNLGLFSFYWATFPIVADLSFQISGFASPMIGIGINKLAEPPPSKPDIDMIIKVTDNSWKPKPEFGSISPDLGEQETILTAVTITGVNTTFLDGSVNVAFIPQDGLSVSRIAIINDTTIEFDLEIYADAPLGNKTVVVTFNNGNESIIGNNIFWVRELWD